MTEPARRNRIKKTDYSRVLTTETLPYETPIIFSNDGLQRFVKTASDAPAVARRLIETLVVDKDKEIRETTPFHYKIKRNSVDFRRLTLLHPISQWRMALFYQKFELLILHYCSLSEASIRAPTKIAGSFFTKSSWENINEYKDSSVGLLATDKFARHSPSFFAYRGVDRLHKFFQSEDYFELEKRFLVMQTLDVSKCFDSIYTHSLSWAVKSKSFTKRHVEVQSTFAQEFDFLIRQCNHNETNGIPIGPEISRIFAEIIFQKIDVEALSKLRDNLKWGSDFEIRRYVDDVYIFASSKRIAIEVYATYADHLLKYNLHTNAAKSLTLERPFVTAKSRITADAADVVTVFLGKFLESRSGEALFPKKIHNRFALCKSFIDSVKSVCASNSAKYDDISSYLVSVLGERIKKLVHIEARISEQDELNYRDALMVLLESMYFLYVVSPSVSASYKLATSIILAIRFCRDHLKAEEETVKLWIYQLIEPLFPKSDEGTWNSIDGMISLELVNILLAIRELGSRHLLPRATIDNLFSSKKELSYFDLVSCLFYIRNFSEYKIIRIRIVKAIDRKLSTLKAASNNAEIAHLLLDALSCPYIHNRTKKKWIWRLERSHNLAASAPDDLAIFLTKPQQPWFVDWTNVDLLNSLEKKELKRAY